ncbi:hypothetical protein V5O48_002002 [Marasmius crinis-equi]|uniref:Uncharacterized protein n=1 Tax=Marasmius crinis-equi TaxID=585013 RepID=A0ABR3FWY3_9AGAR
MPHTLPLIPLNLADIVIHTFLYGIFFVLSSVSIVLLCFPGHATTSNREKFDASVLRRPMFIGSVALFMTITAHWVCEVIRLFQAMVHFKGGTAPLEYYVDISQPIYLVKTGLLVASVVTGDLIIIYRLWTVWNGRLIIVLLPSLTTIGVAVSGSIVTYLLTQDKVEEDIFDSTILEWVIIEGIFAVLTDVYCTGFIAWRIFSTNRRVQNLSYAPNPSPTSIRLKHAAVILTESAILSSSWTIVFIATFSARHPSQSLVGDCLPPVIGIACGLINVRARLARARTANYQTSTMPSFHVSRFAVDSNTEDSEELPGLSIVHIDIVIHTFLYGISFVLTLVSIGLLCFPIHPIGGSSRKKGASLLKKPMFIGALALFVTITAHWICNVLRLFQAMVHFKGGTAPLEYYADLSQTIYAVKTGLIMASIVTGDIMIIYRLWVVWNGKWYIILPPSLTAAGVAASGSGITYELTQYKAGVNIFTERAEAWVICESVFTVLTNVYCTGLIAWRIWTTNVRSVPQDSKRTSGSVHLTAAMVILIESAVLYSSWLIVFIATYTAKHPIESLIVDCLPPVAGISFGLINVRAHLSRARATYQEAASAMPSFHLSRFGNTATSSGGDEELAYPMQPRPKIHFSSNATHSMQNAKVEVSRAE